jgi:Mg-chelatase subunit ChlD
MVCVVDRSGSMEARREDAVGGFNAFLEAQRRLPGRARLTLVLFNHEYGPVAGPAPLESFPTLDSYRYIPAGTTALLDAIGRSIEELGARLDKTPPAERPDKVVFAILTDGLENASSDYTREKVLGLIRSRGEESGWEFAYLGANQDAIQEGGSLGIAADRSAGYDASAGGVRGAFGTLNEMVSESRTRPTKRRGGGRKAR